MILYQLFIAAYTPPQNLAASEKNHFICWIWAVPSWVILLISPGTIHEVSVIWWLNWCPAWCRTVSFTCFMFVPAVCEASFSPISLVLKEASQPPQASSHGGVSIPGRCQWKLQDFLRPRFRSHTSVYSVGKSKSEGQPSIWGLGNYSPPVDWGAAKSHCWEVWVQRGGISEAVFANSLAEPSLYSLMFQSFPVCCLGRFD